MLIEDNKTIIDFGTSFVWLEITDFVCFLLMLFPLQTSVLCFEQKPLLWHNIHGGLGRLTPF